MNCAGTPLRVRVWVERDGVETPVPRNDGGCLGGRIGDHGQRAPEPRRGLHACGGAGSHGAPPTVLLNDLRPVELLAAARGTGHGIYRGVLGYVLIRSFWWVLLCLRGIFRLLFLSLLPTSPDNREKRHSEMLKEILK